MLFLLVRYTIAFTTCVKLFLEVSSKRRCPIFSIRPQAKFAELFGKSFCFPIRITSVRGKYEMNLEYKLVAFIDVSIQHA